MSKIKVAYFFMGHGVYWNLVEPFSHKIMHREVEVYNLA